MAKYHELRMTRGGETFVFLTRGESEPFSYEEALTYLLARETETASGMDSIMESKVVTPNQEVEGDEVLGWRVPNDKNRLNMFRRDLGEGIEFCERKYGQPAEVIKAEAKRIASNG